MAEKEQLGLGYTPTTNFKNPCESDAPPPSYNDVVNPRPNSNSFDHATSSTACASAPELKELENWQTSSQISTIPGNEFSVMDDIRNINQSLRPTNPNVDLLLSILRHRTHDERLEIRLRYKKKCGQDLTEHLKQILNGNLLKTVTGLVVPYYEFLSNTIHDSSNFIWLCYILFTIPNTEIADMKIHFKTKYYSVEKYIEDKLSSGSSEAEVILKPLLKMLKGNRCEDQSNLNEDKVRSDVLKLNSIVGGNSLFGIGNDEKNIIKEIFFYESFNHIKAVCYEYTRQNNGEHVSTVINKVYPQYHTDIFMNIINYAINKHYYFATLLKRSMKKTRTDNHLLIHVMIRRFSEGDLMEVKSEFERQNANALANYIKGDTTGHYRNALLSLIGEYHYAGASRVGWN